MKSDFNRNSAIELIANVKLNHIKNISALTAKLHPSSRSSSKNAKPSARLNQESARLSQNCLPTPQRKKPCKFISQKRPKPKSRSINFLF